MSHSLWHTYNNDSPDGEDCLKKAAYTSRAASIIGIYTGIVDVFVNPPKGGIGLKAGRVMYYMLPAAAMGAVYASTACLAGDYRKKESPMNHILAGFAAGCTWGIARSSFGLAFGSGAMFALIGGFYKEHQMRGMKIYREDVYPITSQRDGLWPAYLRKPPQHLPDVKDY